MRLTTAQALVRFLANQYVERDGREARFFAACFGIFGHGNVAGIGQALHQHPDLLAYYQARNEQSMVHTAVGYARMRNRLGAMACTSSIGPGATNMVTGAALATVNRLPVLLLPGDVFASRIPDPVLQQLEVPWRGEVSVNDAFQPVSRYWDRVNRPEQLMPAALAAMRVLTSPAETGAATLCLPQDVQAEAFDFPEDFLAPRTWHIPRPLPDTAAMDRALAAIRGARRPLVVAGGGVIYAEATEALIRFAERTGIPVVETQAGKGSLPWDHAQNLGPIGVSGGLAANRLAREADLVIGIGTRWTDFTTASQTAFPKAGFISVNVAEIDTAKQNGLALLADARRVLELLGEIDYRVPAEYEREVAELRQAWRSEVDRLRALDGERPAQSAVIGAVNDAAGAHGVMVCAAGSMPSELHKLWRADHPKAYHVEYGYSCMGYEVAGALGVKMAAPEREVYAMCGDGSYLMLSEAIVTSIAEDAKLVVVLVDNHGYASIGGLSRSLGTEGFGTAYPPTDLAINAASLGAIVLRAKTVEELREALAEAAGTDRTTVVYVETDPTVRVPDYESWWDVPVAEVSEKEAVQAARREYEDAVRRRG
ncbi:MAG TPA: 3D-(3,5/4)-trihydroxycyclohexane-1,2-dione acylhydrolase (decyclizing) [Candidatus Dormibacteraeota bacterium]|jgi:3D-(3,5/4)-trihydroxycyclohexane-1,2-dione acylhydrolase (decyclizing)|nr:3D-(3,5/4)-trihydroxycyclohexane-1,2-dione acylhydrolase (decyclizing) [Candidatus Dormibacteraeota bacterium]